MSTRLSCTFLLMLLFFFLFHFFSVLVFFFSLLIAQFTAGFVYSRTLSIRSKMAEEICLDACLCVGFVFFFCIKLSHFHSEILDLRKLPVIIHQYIQSLPIGSADSRKICLQYSLIILLILVQSV